MTVIAWDGQTLAADRACNIGGVLFSVTKLRRCEGALLAVAGDGTRLEEVVAWYRLGANPETFPKRPTPENESVLVVIDRWDGKPRVRRFEATGYPMIIEHPFYADGAGRDAAMAAMLCGKSAREAVIIANRVLSYCGLGVDTLTLEGG